MKYNHNCEHRQTCDNYLYSTCEGCSLNKGIWTTTMSFIRGSLGSTDSLE